MTRLIFWAGGVVALAAVAATAHGGYAVAVACLVPPGVAWLYPLITDGLALVAYGATSRTSNGGRRYAWAIVVAAAAMSGLAQAVFLGSGSNLGSSPGHLTVAPGLAFGVGAWPAVAVALVAHLLYLLHRAEHQPEHQPPASDDPPVTCDEAWAEFEQQFDDRGDNRSWETAPLAESQVTPDPDPVDPPSPDPGSRPVKAITLAMDAATKHAAENGALPTLSQLEAITGVSRGTAVNAIKRVKATTNGHQL